MHEELYILRDQLQDMYQRISDFQPPSVRLPILDSSLDLASPEEGQWLLHDRIPGLNKLRDAVRMDFDVLVKFLEDPELVHLPPPSTNAPYLIAVWNEILCAQSRILAVFKSFLPKPPGSSRHRQRAPKPPGIKVDVVCDNGRQWVRVNTMKNSRLLAEFRELDSYLTSSDSGPDKTSIPSRPNASERDFDNSLLRMGCSLLEAAASNPVEGTSHTPKVTLRLTRLDPSPKHDGETTDPRIAKTIQLLEDMGVQVELGERTILPTPVSNAPNAPPINTPVGPTPRINLDLSVLIALISDLTHSPLPATVEEAKQRFVPPLQYREWKQQRYRKQKQKAKKISQSQGSQEDVDVDIGTGDSDHDILSDDLVKHSRSLTNQVLQEMCKGLLQDIHDQLRASADVTSCDSSQVEFWTTPEARDRCIRIISKIGGIDERRRTHALFPSFSLSSEVIQTPEDAEAIYWQGSRYTQSFLPILPIHIYPSTTPSPNTQHGAPFRAESHLPPFFKSLSRTCQYILAQEVIPDPRTVPEAEDPNSEIPRALVTRVNPRLTAHTIQSMLWGAELGWTTLTANKSSIKAILRELRGAKMAGKLDADFNSELPEACRRAAIWIVDPRSLAEGMRSDYSL